MRTSVPGKPRRGHGRGRATPRASQHSRKTGRAARHCGRLPAGTRSEALVTAPRRAPSCGRPSSSSARATLCTDRGRSSRSFAHQIAQRRCSSQAMRSAAPLRATGLPAGHAAMPSPRKRPSASARASLRRRSPWTAPGRSPRPGNPQTVSLAAAAPRSGGRRGCGSSRGRWPSAVWTAAESASPRRAPRLTSCWAPRQRPPGSLPPPTPGGLRTTAPS
mmetsp:Transcript_31829/g.75567  ORF Transcript_31829/g.75567 Transcript_31829/m.75567 type:complete len:219 (-) Transcript_31829:427-1083(-)